MTPPKRSTAIEYNFPFQPKNAQFSLMHKIYDVMKYSHLVWNQDIESRQKADNSAKKSTTAAANAQEYLSNLCREKITAMDAQYSEMNQPNSEFDPIFKRIQLAFRLNLRCHRGITESTIRHFAEFCLGNDSKVDYIGFQILDRSLLHSLRKVLNELKQQLGDRHCILSINVSHFASDLKYFTYYRDFYGFPENVHFEFLYPQLDEVAVVMKELYSRCSKMIHKDFILWSNGSLNWRNTLSPEERSSKLSTFFHQKLHQPRPILSGRLLEKKKDQQIKKKDTTFSSNLFVPVFGSLHGTKSQKRAHEGGDSTEEPPRKRQKLSE